MDTGWAVVLGASIGLFGSAVVPWLRDALTQRGQVRLKRRQELADAIRHFIDVGAGRFEQEPTSIPQIEASTASLALLLTKDETPIARLVAHTADLIEADRLSDRASEAFYMATVVLPKWYRGEMKADEAEDMFRRGMKGLEAGEGRGQ